MPGRPPTGLGHYLRDVVYGASDGIITTLAVVAGASGASFEPRVGVVLGLANLAADGFSMGASNYLALKTELEQTGASVAGEMPWRHGLATIAAFVIAGSAPLFAYALAPLGRWPVFPVALGLSLISLLVVGAGRGRFVGRPAWLCATEQVAIGALAGGAAFALGLFANSLAR